ncbi:MAG TPA: LysM peptidoglycan-binding domain-containing protein [Mobilitalea sp.]|nr:LysM peptidoglycan-binding domain-containing protein [Mobilitalea sp.]
MEIYVIQKGDTINSIADKFGVSANRLIHDNGLELLDNLVIGQSIIITYPSQTYIVQEGDSLSSIAEAFGITLIELLRNNSFLSDREYIYPGETLVIRYNTTSKVTVNGYAYPFINHNTLIKSLPYLTYLSIFNYRLSEEVEIMTYSNDTEMIQIAKDYGVVPLMMLSSLSPFGEPNIELLFKVLNNKEYHDQLVKNILKILKSSDFHGINIMISGINETNQKNYIDFLTEISKTLKDNGYLLFITINPYLKYTDEQITFEHLDYTALHQIVDGIIFLHYVWSTNTNPPAPVSSIRLIQNLIDYVVKMAPADKITVGKPLIGYDWELPFNPKTSRAYSLTIASALRLAHDVGSIIQFDEESQTPFFQYKVFYANIPVEHIVWFIDARSINVLDQLVNDYNLTGSGIWNMMIYYQQIWSLINSQYEIIKLIPSNL